VLPSISAGRKCSAIWTIGSRGKKKVNVDELKFTDGRITDNRHIEDNLTLLTQMGIAKIEQ